VTVEHPEYPVDTEDTEDPEDPEEAEAWRLGAEFDQAARDPDIPPDPALLAAVADTASDDVLLGLLDELGALCAEGDPPVATHYADHLAALAPLLGPNGHRGVLAAVDLHTAALHLRTGNPGEARLRAERCRADLSDVLPGLLADREWMLAGLAEDEGHSALALAHGLRARDLFAEQERWFEAARVGEAAAGAYPALTADALGDWRRAVELYVTADEPDEARRCVELAGGLLGARLAEPGAIADPALPPLCAQVRVLARTHGLTGLAARLALALAELAAESDRPWAEVAEGYAQARTELSASDLDPEALRADLARADLSRGRAALAHGRVDEARPLLSGAVTVLRDAGTDEEAGVAARMLAALDAAQSPGTAGPLVDDSVTDPIARMGLLPVEALRLAAQGDTTTALARLDEAAALVPDDAPIPALMIDAVRAAVRRGAGDATDVPAVLVRIEAALAAPDGLPRSARSTLEHVAGLLRADNAPAKPAPAVPDRTPAEIDSEIAAVHRLAPDDPDRGPRAAALVAVLVRVDPLGDPARLRPLDDLVEIADGAVPETPEWIRHRTWARLLGLQRRIASGELTDPEAVAERFAPLEAAADADPVLRPLVAATRTVVRMLEGIRHDGPDVANRAAVTEMREALDETVRDHPAIAPILQAMDAMAGMAQCDDPAALPVAEAHRLVEQLPPGHLRAIAEDALAQMSVLQTIRTGDPAGRLDDDQLAALSTHADSILPGDPDPGLRHALVAMQAMQAGDETDPARIEMGIAAMRRAVDTAGPQDPQRVFYMTGVAVGLQRLHELTVDTGALREARDVLEQAWTIAGGPQHPQWQMVNEMLAEVRRLLGDGATAGAAVDGLRRHIWQVLVQPDLASAATAVREAGADATRAAVACLRENDPAGAIGALDAGRGLALFAATEVRSVPERLDEAGETELAQRWRSAVAARDPEQLPRTLRRTVLRRLTEHSAAASLLTPPGLPEIQQALRDLDADALIYLVPGEGHVPGYAIAAAAGTGTGASYLALPGLTIENDPDVERYLTTLNRRDAAAVRGLARDFDTTDDEAADPTTEDGALASSLDAVCGWAWHAAMGPLIESYLPRLPRAATDRPRRIVLVPMGDLARIPWQAARRPDGTHAVALIAISQAASARMLCLGARRPPVPPSPVGLVVGDPDTTDPATGEHRATELAAARLEAYAIRQTFYPGARYVGRLPNGSTSRSGPGSARQVRDWLTASSPGTGTLLHLACHGVLESGAAHATSYLLLADGERLTAEELIEHMAQAPEGCGVGLVVLAACRTGLAISGYDEAYSLGTAFLAGGTDTVLSTQWSVPDGATSVLMYMFHHFLRADGMPAWAALHAAQNWMLDRDRAVPPGMPGPLRRHLDTTSGLPDVIAWAAFVHWGR
jgi:hypothetical protein